MISYAQYDESELESFEPTVVHVDEHNHAVRVGLESVPVAWEGGTERR